MNYDTLRLFKSEFWKDKRKIDIVSFNGAECLLKYYDSEIEMNAECSVIEYLLINDVDNVPRIISRNNSSVLMSYHKGIRIFNLFVILDEYSRFDPIGALNIKRDILDRCEQQQSKIQSLLLKWRSQQAYREPYPSSKLETAISILSECLEVNYDKNRMTEEIKKINNYMIQHAAVPFRDSTTKNMILACEELFLPNYSNELERNAEIFDWIASGKIDRLLSCPIIDIDFSSCINDTTPEDDIIGLKFHQRTWDGVIPYASDLAWNFASNPYRAAVSFIVRFFRFGSRKASYKLLHKETAEKRFKYDDPSYYFEVLPKLVNAICPNVVHQYSELFDFNSKVSAGLAATVVCRDYFRESDLYENETPYVDIFPN